MGWSVRTLKIALFAVKAKVQRCGKLFFTEGIYIVIVPIHSVKECREGRTVRQTHPAVLTLGKNSLCLLPEGILIQKLWVPKVKVKILYTA